MINSNKLEKNLNKDKNEQNNTKDRSMALQDIWISF
jgi:hypothetical protein